MDFGRDEFDAAHGELVTDFSETVGLVKLIKSKTATDHAWTAAWNRHAVQRNREHRYGLF